MIVLKIYTAIGILFTLVHLIKGEIWSSDKRLYPPLLSVCVFLWPVWAIDWLNLRGKKL